MKYREGYKYQLAADFQMWTPIKPRRTVRCPPFITLHPSGHLEIKQGYAWDGASGPTFDTSNTKVPSLVHDAFAQLLSWELLSRDKLRAVNELFRQMLKIRKMWWLRRRLWMRGLWLTGGSFANPENRKRVRTAY